MSECCPLTCTLTLTLTITLTFVMMMPTMITSCGSLRPRFSDISQNNVITKDEFFAAMASWMTKEPMSPRSGAGRKRLPSDDDEQVKKHP